MTAILAQMTEDDRDMFASLPKDRAVLIYRDWPRQLAHQFGLPDNRELLDSCAARGRSTPTQPASRPWQISMHPERAATLIIEGAWERVQSK